MDLFSGFEDGLLRGIGAYARPRKAWRIEHVLPAPEGARKLLALTPSGILIRNSDHVLPEVLLQAKIPIVNIDNLPVLAGVGRVSNDNPKIGAMAAEHFLTRGHTRFAYYAKQPSREDERLLGFQQRLQTAGQEAEVFHGGPNDPNPKVSRAYEQRLTKWLTDLTKPVAVFCDGDRFAWMIAERCRTLALKVPEDVAILGVDNVASVSAISEPALSSIQTASDRIGYEAAQLLDQMLERKASRAAVIKVPPVRVVIRRSTDAVSVPDPLVGPALEHMRAHLTDTAGLVLLSEQLKCSRRTLERRFADVLGITPAEAWSRFRLEEAQRLLADTALSLQAVAAQSGLHSSPQMSAVFKRMTGRTPREFRRLACPGGTS